MATRSSQLSGLAPAGQLAGLLHPTGELSFVELVGFPHVEGALGLGRKVDRGNGREGGAVEEDQLEVGLEGGDREEPALAGSSSALWSLLRADGASGSSHRRVQCHGGANERLQRLFIDLVALMEIDGAPGVAFEAGVEEA